jgi:hypothetical protein
MPCALRAFIQRKCVYTMHIQVIAPNVETRLTKYPKTFEEEVETLRKTRKQNARQRRRAGQGTPFPFTRAKIFGAFPSAARP